MIIQAVPVPNSMDNESYNSLLNYVSINKRNKLSQMLLYRDAYRSLIGEVAIRLIISQTYNIPNNALHFSCSQYGKPIAFCLGFPFYFNISHSADWVVVISDSSPVGIDIEKIEEIDISFAKKYFTSKEVAYLNSLKKKEQIYHFYKLWTLKESFIKFIGMGLSIPLDSFSFLQHNNYLESSLVKNYEFKKYTKGYLNLCNLDSDYAVSVCCSAPFFPQEIEQLTFSDFYTQTSSLEEYNGI